MESTYAEQIEAIQTARTILKENGAKTIDRFLNDAASTIAALNLTKDLPKPADQSWEEYFEELINQVDSYFNERYEIEGKHKDTIKAMTYDRIREANKLLRDLADLQNGPPLEQHRKEWEETMEEVYKFLK